MAQSNDSILVTPGSGATVATHLVSAKEYQVMMAAGESGHINGTPPTYIHSSQNSANVAAARTTHFDLYNATGSGLILRVYGIYIIPTQTAVVGIGLTFEILTTSAVGTGGTVRTAGKLDTSNTDLPAQVTARSKPTAGATTLATIAYLNTSSEETSPYAALASQLNHLPVINGVTQPLVLRETFGVKVDQTLNSAIGSTNVVFVLTATAT